MNNVDLGNQYKKIIQFFWDPEPKNDDSGLPIWCLGCEYQQPAASSQASTQILEPESHHASQELSSERPSERPSEADSVSKKNETQERRSYGKPGERRTSTDDNRPTTPSSAISSFVHLSTPAGSGSAEAATPAWPPLFLDDFESRLWITYRSHFPPIPKTGGSSSSSMPLGVRLRSQLIDTQGFTSDTGWGCMIRSGQSLLANTLLFLRLGRGWRRGSQEQEESELLSLFADHPRAPFSIHRFVQHGATACGKCPGEWFGPAAAAQCIQALANGHPQAGLNVYITSDGSDIYERQFREIACRGLGEDGEDDSIKPTLILLGVRLGIDRVTPVYWESLKEVIRFPQSVGIAGGRPSSSHYFIATQGDTFFYLDPHQTRPSLPPRTAGEDVYSPGELSTYHTRRLRRLHIREMDPSMLIGFLVRDEGDWEDLKGRIRRTGGKAGIIHIFDDEGSAREAGCEREGAEEEVESFDEF
ncbi:Cysteine protease atg4 [Microsporum canis]|uniref:Cysteine protease n=1 Tax=Arthroderma otae (strain ATCC MYA-4605 / CBS 113480) TaxID=554155 RepID=C5G087_ARTOC|nr:cysteine protease atg4 [Microsporum canis CBS 113480]EEQ35540.1 cysteine protease atg4 [Microsporum canis CBS 113480]